MTNILTIKRIQNKHNSTIGELWLGDELVGFTVEDGKNIPKIKNETRIPAGRYRLGLREEGSMTLRYVQRYGEWHKGMLWLLNVPEFEFVYIHIGNTIAETSGCILVGNGGFANNSRPARTIQSRLCYQHIYPAVADLILNGEEVYVLILDELEKRFS